MVYLSAWMFDSEGNGNWSSPTIEANQARNGNIYNADHNNGDNVSYKAYMRAGTYTCKILGQTGSAYGILKLKIDGVEVVSWDQYSAAANTYNQISTTTSIVIATSGVKTIQVIVEGKHASSSDHYIVWSEIVFYRTA